MVLKGDLTCRLQEENRVQQSYKAGPTLDIRQKKGSGKAQTHNSKPLVLHSAPIFSSSMRENQDTEKKPNVETYINFLSPFKCWLLKKIGTRRDSITCVPQIKTTKPETPL